ncbi:SRPBCC family protein [Bacillus sp. NPDC094106]|uniref:SRPBCC family protein n=1 Tax=Bacillus sp. NPDC094106 TaxID=3363949 RepID=UPI00382A3BDF
MLALIEKRDNEYVAQFNRLLHYSVEQVWAVLTENEKLTRWMPNLHVEDLRKGGMIKFDMMDGSGEFIDIDILECQINSVLEFTWGEDRVRFEIHKNPEGCLFVLKEFIHEINDHTPKDLSGWHIGPTRPKKENCTLRKYFTNNRTILVDLKNRPVITSFLF